MSDPHSISPRASKTCSESDDFSNLYLIWEVPLTHKHGSVADLSGKCRLKWPARRGRHSDGGYHEGPTRQVELPKLLFTHCHCRQSKKSAGDKEAGTYSGSWTPPSVMEFVTDASGKVTGNAKLGQLEFKIDGSVKPAADNIPEGVRTRRDCGTCCSVYNLRGFFLANSDHIVGTVVSIGNDLAYQPIGMSGPFVLYPVKS